ncbi:MAG TPA: LapA family protein [Gammaproteobacteria bacterium]|nr:LapA family protein [Gammaproteobacteria bacterium]
MRVVYYLLLIIVVLLGATFATLNLQTVSINYYLDQASMPLAILLALTFGSGCVFGLVVGFWLLFKSKLKHYRLRQRLNMIEKELENLRALPLRGS